MFEKIAFSSDRINNLFRCLRVKILVGCGIFATIKRAIWGKFTLLLDGVSSLDSGPAARGAFFFGRFEGSGPSHFVTVGREPSAFRMGDAPQQISRKNHNPVKQSRNALWNVST